MQQSEIRPDWGKGACRWKYDAGLLGRHQGSHAQSSQSASTYRGAFSEVTVGFKRKAIFHGSILVFAACSPDHAVDNLPSTRQRAGLLTSVLVVSASQRCAVQITQC
jgi:hypothetical protein